MSLQLQKPCRVGDKIADIETPALVVSMEKLEENIKLMKNIMKSYPGVLLRPHAKTHKCPEIARMQVQYSACQRRNVILLLFSFFVN